MKARCSWRSGPATTSTWPAATSLTRPQPKPRSHRCLVSSSHAWKPKLWVPRTSRSEWSANFSLLGDGRGKNRGQVTDLWPPVLPKLQSLFLPHFSIYSITQAGMGVSERPLTPVAATLISCWLMLAFGPEAWNRKHIPSFNYSPSLQNFWGQSFNSTEGNHSASVVVFFKVMLDTGY